MPTIPLPEDAAAAPAFCPSCRGVIPFRRAHGGSRALCTRCGTAWRRFDPGASARWNAARYLSYGAAAGMIASLQAAGAAALKLPMTWEEGITASALLVLAASCLARSAALWGRASSYERLQECEWAELERRLCPGMLRSDVHQELARRGWRPGKIRAALDAHRPDDRFRAA
ncbi:MAG TPA: hypothetical protein VJV23_07370 [Candidatus Polarisedimenticolia bacterium]|nr:hypothetical protein [Candidatus Polarisedimenticolia bacterium]